MVPDADPHAPARRKRIIPSDETDNRCPGAGPVLTCNQMVEQRTPTDADIDRVFHALADATRRDIVRRTLVAEQSVSALAAGYAMSFAAVSKHIGVLVEAGLVRKRADGRERLVQADPSAIARVQQLLRSYEDLWRGRIDRLDALFAEDPDATASGIHPPTTTEN